MPFPDLALIALLATAFLFSIIELGISAYAVSVTDGRTIRGVRYRGDVPGEYAFLLFASLWTLLAIGVLGALDFLGARRGVSHPYPWLGWAALGVNFVTWVFWLSGFAALAAYFGGTAVGTAGALMAFAVMLWLIFTAILILNALTAFSVLRSDRHSFKPLFSRDGKVSRPTNGPAMTTA